MPGRVATGVQATIDELGTPLREVTFVVVDLETTGGSPEDCGITEIGAVRVHGGAVVGEFVGSNSGIGYVMQRSIGTFDLPTMFAALVILALLGVVLFWIVDRIEKLIIPWHVSQREDVIFAS